MNSRKVSKAVKEMVKVAYAARRAYVDNDGNPLINLYRIQRAEEFLKSLNFDFIMPKGYCTLADEFAWKWEDGDNYLEVGFELDKGGEKSYCFCWNGKWLNGDLAWEKGEKIPAEVVEHVKLIAGV